VWYSLEKDKDITLYVLSLRLRLARHRATHVPVLLYLGAIHLDTVEMPTVTHSDRCLEALHCSSAVSGWWAVNRVH